MKVPNALAALLLLALFAISATSVHAVPMEHAAPAPAEEEAMPAFDEDEFNSRVLYIHPDSHLDLHDHVIEVDDEHVGPMLDCYNDKVACHVPHEHIRRRDLQEDDILFSYACNGGKGFAMVINKIMRHNETHGMIAHSVPGPQDLWRDIYLEASHAPFTEQQRREGSTVSARGTPLLEEGNEEALEAELHRQGRRNVGKVATAVMKHGLSGTTQYALTEYASAYRSGPTFKLALSVFKLNVTWEHGLSEFEVTVTASSTWKVGIKGSFDPVSSLLGKALSFNKAVLSTGDLPLAIIPIFTAVTLNFNFKAWLSVNAAVDTSFAFDYGYAVNGKATAGLYYNKHSGNGWETRRSFETSHGKIASFKYPSFDVTAGITGNIEFAAMISLGPIGLVGPYFRLSPGLSFTLTMATLDYLGDAFVDLKVGIKGPSWETAWFKFGVEWGKTFRLWELPEDKKFKGNFGSVADKFLKLIDPEFSYNGLIDAEYDQPDEVPTAVAEEHGALPSEDDINNARYVVKVFTGDDEDAGSDADTFVAFIRDSAGFEEHHWVDNSENNFERNQMDTFVVKSRRLDDVDAVIVGMDSGWLESKVEGGSWQVSAVSVSWDGNSKTFASDATDGNANERVWVGYNHASPTTYNGRSIESVVGETLWEKQLGPGNGLYWAILKPKENRATYHIKIETVTTTFGSEGTDYDITVKIYGSKGSLTFALGSDFGKGVNYSQHKAKDIGVIYKVEFTKEEAPWYSSDDEWKPSTVFITSSSLPEFGFNWYCKYNLDDGEDDACWLHDDEQPLRFCLKSADRDAEGGIAKTHYCA